MGLAFACPPACLPGFFAGLLGVVKACENPGSWWCQTAWVIWRLAAWEGFTESSLAYIRQFNLSFPVTQVVGSELFRGRSIYSRPRGIPSLHRSCFIPGRWAIGTAWDAAHTRRAPQELDWLSRNFGGKLTVAKTWNAARIPPSCWIGWAAWKMVNDHLDQLQAFSCVVCHNSWFWSGKKTNSLRAKKGAEFDGVGCTFMCHFPPHLEESTFAGILCRGNHVWLYGRSSSEPCSDAGFLHCESVFLHAPGEGSQSMLQWIGTNRVATPAQCSM